MDEIKSSLGMFKMKGISNKGNITRHYFEIFSDGTISINQFILSEESELIGFEPMVTRFGKTLHRSIIAFKYGTFAGIHETLNETLRKNNITSKQII